MKQVKPIKAQGHTVSIQCPKCQQQQSATQTAVSIFCKSCQNLIRVQEVLRPQTEHKDKKPDQQSSQCFRCQAIVEVFKKSQSFLCKKCGYRNDLQDYNVKSALSQNIETRGSLTVGPHATILNSTAHVTRALVRGKFIGSLEADHIELKKNAVFEGNIKTGTLQIETPLDLKIQKKFEADHLIIEGALKGKIAINGTVELGNNTTFYGEIYAKKLIVRETANFLGIGYIGERPKTESAQFTQNKQEKKFAPLRPQETKSNIKTEAHDEKISSEAPADSPIIEKAADTQPTPSPLSEKRPSYQKDRKQNKGEKQPAKISQKGRKKSSKKSSPSNKRKSKPR